MGYRGDVSEVDLASTANGLGASMAGIEDAGGFYVSIDVEGALQELGGAVAVPFTSTDPFPPIPNDATLVLYGTGGGTLLLPMAADRPAASAPICVVNTSATVAFSVSAQVGDTLGAGVNGVGIIDAGQLRFFSSNGVDAWSVSHLSLISTFAPSGASNIGYDGTVSFPTIDSGDLQTVIESIGANIDNLALFKQTIDTPSDFTLPAGGSAFRIIATKAGTTTVSSVITFRRRASTGTPAAGFGLAAPLVTLQDTAGADINASSHQTVWVTAGSGAANCVSGMNFFLQNLGTFGNFMRLEPTKFGVLGKAATPAVASALGASLTNNVVRTGAANVLPDFANGTVYATDYANLHATIGELANKVALLELQMKANGFAVT